MKYFSPNAILPLAETGLLEAIDKAAQELENRLHELNLDALQISDYNKRYLGQYLANLDPVLRRYAFVLAWGLADDSEAPIGSSLLDYGGGTGFLCLLAKSAGVEKVLYSDYYSVSCRDAQLLGRELGLEADVYIHGEMQEVLDYVQQRKLSVDVVANNDVIEHIYDMESFLAQTPRLSSRGLRLAFATGANAANPRLALKLMKLQWLREHRDRQPEFGNKQMDTLRGYRSLRKEIIQELQPHLPQADVAKLAALTRGRNRRDIEMAVREFLNSGLEPKPPLHPTNTCDPISSSWAEHLMNPWWILANLRKAGFDSRVVPGPYGWRRDPKMRVAARLLDLGIKNLGLPGIALSPYLVFVGHHPGT